MELKEFLAIFSQCLTWSSVYHGHQSSGSLVQWTVVFVCHWKSWTHLTISEWLLTISCLAQQDMAMLCMCLRFAPRVVIRGCRRKKLLQWPSADITLDCKGDKIGQCVLWVSVQDVCMCGLALEWQGYFCWHTVISFRKTHPCSKHWNLLCLETFKSLAICPPMGLNTTLSQGLYVKFFFTQSLVFCMYCKEKQLWNLVEMKVKFMDFSAVKNHPNCKHQKIYCHLATDWLLTAFN